MIGEPQVEVTCDKCSHNENYPMTPLVRQSYDMRDLEKQLVRDGWKVDGDTHICDSCQEDEDTE